MKHCFRVSLICKLWSVSRYKKLWITLGFIYFFTFHSYFKKLKEQDCCFWQTREILSYLNFFPGNAAWSQSQRWSVQLVLLLPRDGGHPGGDARGLPVPRNQGRVGGLSALDTSLYRGPTFADRGPQANLACCRFSVNKAVLEQSHPLSRAFCLWLLLCWVEWLWQRQWPTVFFYLVLHRKRHWSLV